MLLFDVDLIVCLSGLSAPGDDVAHLVRSPRQRPLAAERLGSASAELEGFARAGLGPAGDSRRAAPKAPS